MTHVKRAGALRRALATAIVLAGAACPYAQDQPAAGTPAATEREAATTGGTADASANNQNLPPGERIVRVVSANFDINRILQKFAEQGVTVSARGKTSGVRIPSFIVRDIPAREALNQLINTQPNWLLYEPADRPGTFEIWDQESYRAEVLPRLVRPKTFVPTEITAEEAHKAIQGVLTPNIGTAAFDPRSNKLFVTDLVPVLELVQRLLEQIDVKFITRVFYIRHADINSIAEKLANLKSPAAPAPEVDVRTRQIIVRDRLDVLRQMEQIVETLDIGPELRVYDINNTGIDGEELADLEEAIAEIITEEALFRMNVRQGRMILRDVPEVHEQVEKILAAFDQPVKQVLLQAEIIETEFSEGFNYSIDYAFSRDLFAATIDNLTGGIVPTGSVGAGTGTGTGATAANLDPDTLGFINFRREFPVITGGSGGISAQFLTRNAYVRLQSAMSDSRTRILQQPRILVENQKTALFTVGQQIPFFTGGSIGTLNTGNNSTLTPSQPVQQLLNVGLELEVTPIITNSGLVEMEVLIRNNTPLFQTLRFNGQTFDGVGKNNQELETTLLIPSGETRVIGGLVADAKGESRSGIPGLIKIPVIGPLLFGSYNRPANDNRRRNLLIFLTPTIVVEKAGDLLKYKGQVVAEEPEHTLPNATLTDVTYDAQPLLPPDKTTYLEPGMDYEPTFTPPVELPPADETLEPVQVAPPVDARDVYTETDIISTEPGSDVAELRRIRVDESQISTDTLRSLLPRVPSPSGALGPGTGVTGGTVPAPAPGTGAPAGAPGAPVATAPAAGGQPAVATPGIFQQPGGQTNTTVVVQPGTSGGVQPTPAVSPNQPPAQPPGPETTVR